MHSCWEALSRGWTDVFAQGRTARRAQRLAWALVGCPPRHTVTHWLRVAGLADRDWSANYRLFSEAPWQAVDLFDPLLREVLRLLAPADPFVAALDDTAVKKTGRRIRGVAYRRDPLSPPFHCNLVRAQRFGQLSGLVPAGPLPSRARAIPLDYRHLPSVPKPKRTDPAEVWAQYRARCREDNLSVHGAQMIARLRERLDRAGAGARPLVVGVDGSYCNRTVLRSRPDHRTLLMRVRQDAKLYGPAPRAPGGDPNGLRRFGPAQPTPEALRRNESVPWQSVPAFAAGGLREFSLKTLAPVFWRKTGPDLPLRLVVIRPVGYRLRPGSRLLYRQPAHLLCTDVTLPLPALLQYYLWRWEIEVNHRDEKQLLGVGEAQVRAELSVDRLPAFVVACYAMLLVAGIQAFGAEATAGTLAPPKWRRPGTKPRLSTQDFMEELQCQLRRDLFPLAPTTSDPFATALPPVTKSSEPPRAPVLLAT